MASKAELQTTLKEKFNINKNITDALSHEDCEALLHLLHQESSVANLVQSFANKNTDLGHRNREFGRQREQAKRQLQHVEAEYLALEQTIQDLNAKKTHLKQDEQVLLQQIAELEANKQRLNQTVNQLTVHNQELLAANDTLKKDNKYLKNVVDQIRLRLAIDIEELLKYEDSEIRKALIRLFKWTLG